jgi:hypothetical protein
MGAASARIAHTAHVPALVLDVEGLRIAPWRTTLGDAPPEGLAIASHESVERVDKRRQS